MAAVLQKADAPRRGRTREGEAAGEAVVGRAVAGQSGELTSEPHLPGSVGRRGEDTRT